MPFTYRIDPEAGVLFVASEREVTQVERLEAMRAWQSDPNYRPGLNTFCDFTRGTSTPSLAELQEIAGLMTQQAALIGKIRLAVVTAKPVVFGAARQFEALVDSSVDVHVFTDHEAAWAWLQGTPRAIG